MSCNLFPLVSIIINTYNRVQVLPRALNSVLSQTYPNIEVLVVDDNSDDETEKYMETIDDVRVRYIKNSVNMGASGARNKGAECASGDIIAFQDDDDEWPEDKLEKQMDILLDDSSIKLVYCGIAMYSDNKLTRILPSPDIPIEQKQGNIFHYLLLQPLISTQTILVWKKEFFEIGGFDEKVKSLIDYEFSIRFAQKFKIGFAGNVLVNVYDSPVSVSKRCEEKIRTQMLIVENMFGELNKVDLLWDKLVFVKNQAARYGCMEVFYAELSRLAPMIKSEDEIKYQILLLDDRERERKENDLKLTWFYNLEYMQQNVQKMYEDFTQNVNVWDLEMNASVLNIANIIREGARLFRVGESWEKERQALDKILSGPLQIYEEKLSALLQLYRILEVLEKEVSEQLYQCNVCYNNVFFKPRSDYYEKHQKLNGFPYWNARMETLNRENAQCPVCGALERDRLIIAFLEELQPENNEKLKMLHIAPSKTIEKYALKRSDILYESTDLMMHDVTFRADIQAMNMVTDDTYDILVCSHVLEYVENDRKAMSELFRIMKKEGALIVLVPLIVGKETTEEEWGLSEAENWKLFGQGDHSRLYGRKDFVQRLQEAGFIVNELGVEYFGEEFYNEHGFDEYSILYIATKTDVL